MGASVGCFFIAFWQDPAKASHRPVTLQPLSLVAVTHGSTQVDHEPAIFGSETSEASNSRSSCRPKGVHLRMHKRAGILISIVAAVGITFGTLAGVGASSAPSYVPPHLIGLNGAESAIGVPSGATPDNTFSSCASTDFCGWENAGYSGTLWSWSIKDYPANTWFGVGKAANDQISSIYNNRTNSTYIDKDFPPTSPDEACISEQEVYSDLSDYTWADGSSANDSISSFNLIGSNEC
jgi:hypothetical protein